MTLPAPLPENFTLSTDFIDVWITPTTFSPATLTAFSEMLSPHERARRDRIRIPAKKHEALVSRGLLRYLLGAALHHPPHALSLATGPHGKPFLDAPAHAHLRFNLSHTAGILLLALTHTHDLGVDIETIDESRSHLDLAHRFFTPTEAAAIAAHPPHDRPRAFFTCWSRKEAILKATGLGVAGGLHSCEVPVTPLTTPVTIARTTNSATESWTLHPLPTVPPYVASLATCSPAAHLRLHHLPSSPR